MIYPGVLDWSTGVYNPTADITKDTTTLYASDRDVFLFLVDDLNPIEAGKLPDGWRDQHWTCWALCDNLRRTAWR